MEADVGDFGLHFSHRDSVMSLAVVCVIGVLDKRGSIGDISLRDGDTVLLNEGLQRIMEGICA
jgi:hypothetical protein